MKKIDFSGKDDYSKVGKSSAKLFSYILDRSEKIKQLLKNKDYKRYLEQDYFEKEDKESFDDSKELNFEDIYI